MLLGLIGSRYLDQHVSPPRWSTLKPAKIRGIQTEGMVMSEAELGLSDSHEGIIRLDPSTPLGLSAREVLGDIVLEIEVTPNNGRLLGIVGLAREVAALFGGEVRYPSTEWHEDGPPAESLVSVEIEDRDLCPRYTAAVVQSATVGPSPYWMQRRLSLAGMRPINNIVDITNYVMLEMGQPLHAFNYHAVEGRKIVVRRARDGETITTLDHVERRLDSQMLAICDVNRPQAIAGVMGGAESEIGSGSSDVLLESAHFNPTSIRRTARLFKLHSEASYRFERWVDPNLTVPAMKRAAELMRLYAGGTIARGYVDNYPAPQKPTRIHFYTSEVERLLGIEVPPTQIADMLTRLEFKVDLPHNADAVGRDTTMIVNVPTYRNDVSHPADLVEEVARMIGYDVVPETLPCGGLPRQEPNRRWEFSDDLRDYMVACGLDEVMTYSVTYSQSLEKLFRMESAFVADGSRPQYRSWDPARPLVTIVNPVSSKQDVLRPTLLPNLLETLRANLRNRPGSPVKIFELGSIFLARTAEEVEQRRVELEEERERYPRLQQWKRVPNEERLPMEPLRLAGMMSGPRTPRSLYIPDSESPESQLDFFDAKGVVEELLSKLHIEQVEWIPADAPLFHPGRVAVVRAGGADLGVVGELHPTVTAEWEIPAERIAAWDLDAEALFRIMPSRVLYTTVSPYQPEKQDMAFVVPEEMQAATVAQAIQQAGGPTVTGVALFDIYRGKPVPEGSKSLAFEVTFNSPEKALTEEDLARLRKRIEGMLSRELGAELRR